MTVGAGLAAWLAVREAPTTTPSTFVSRAIAATVRTGTAQFTLSEQSGGGYETIGFGSVNFRTQAVDLLVETHESESVTTPLSQPKSAIVTITMQEVHAGGHTYNRVSLPNLPGRLASTELRALPDVPGPLGELRTTEASEVISPLITQPSDTQFATGPTSEVGGVVEVEHARLPRVQTCRLAGAAGYRSTSTNSLTVWLDHQGRIRQVRSVMSGTEHAGNAPLHHFRTVSTLTFTSFGKPTDITAPRVTQNPPGSVQSVAVGRNITSTCSS
jgi:hypothetical protein